MEEQKGSISSKKCPNLQTFEPNLFSQFQTYKSHVMTTYEPNNNYINSMSNSRVKILTGAVRRKSVNTQRMSLFLKNPYSTYSTYSIFHIGLVFNVIVYSMYTTNNTTSLFSTSTVSCKELV